MDCWRRSVAIKRLVGYVPGEPALDPGMTGGQILAYFAHLRGGVERAYLDELVERFGLDPSRPFRQYSSGNKRKVVLVQAFMHRPRVLILDEPTAGLDPINQQGFHRLVAETKGAGSTVFLSSHVLSEVEQACDRVAIIRAGELVRVGGLTELKDIKRHTVTITFAREVPADAFGSVAGVDAVEVLDGARALRLSVTGELDAVIKAAARFPVVTLATHEPSLEEIFLRYYQGADDVVA
jgi:ABC-2 type transport system ATP-binding protein